MGFIYKLQFSNGKSYVGLTIKTVQYRYRQHERVANNGGRSKSAIYAAWRKHGAPVVSTLGEYPNEELYAQEIQHVEKEGSFGVLGYNMTPGGETNPSTVPEIAERIRAFKSTPGAKAKQSATSTKYWSVEENRKKQSETLKNVVRSPEKLARYSIQQKAIQGTPEARKAQSERSKIRYQNPDYVAKRKEIIPPRSEASRERSRVAVKIARSKPESRAKSSATKVANWADPVYRANNTQAQKDAWANPEIREKRLAAGRATRAAKRAINEINSHVNNPSVD